MKNKIIETILIVIGIFILVALLLRIIGVY